MKNQVFILLGQSQAVGHGIPMEAKDLIVEPMKNVFGLHRRWNQSCALDHLTWSGYTSSGMNLAEEQDDTYSLANCLATLWQRAIDQGQELLNLYVIQIAIGAEGVTDKYLPDGTTRPYMWNPAREQRMIPGRLGTVDISLYPFAQQILSLVEDSFRRMGQPYEVMELLWRGGENEIETPVEVLRGSLRGIYEEIFSGLQRALGGDVPLTLNRIVSYEAAHRRDPSGGFETSMDYINEVFGDMAREHANARLFDIRTAPFHDVHATDQGIFVEDLVHYTPKTNWWHAQQILDEYMDKNAATE